MDLSKSIVAVRSCHSAIQLRRHRKASPVLSILRTPTRKSRQESWICQGKRTRTNSPLDSIRFQPESACESSRLCVYSDIQFTPTGDEPVIKTYVSVRNVQFPFHGPPRRYCNTLLSVIGRLEIITSGASGRTRTDNLLITNQLHRQLYYGSIHSPCGECEQRELLSKRKELSIFSPKIQKRFGIIVSIISANGLKCIQRTKPEEDQPGRGCWSRTNV